MIDNVELEFLLVLLKIVVVLEYDRLIEGIIPTS